MKKLLIALLLATASFGCASQPKENPRVVDFKQVAVYQVSYPEGNTKIDTVVYCEQVRASMVWQDTSVVFNINKEVQEFKIITQLATGLYLLESPDGCPLPTLLHIYDFKDVGLTMYIQHEDMLTRFSVNKQGCDAL